MCESIEPWEHGVVARAPRYPRSLAANIVRVDEEPRMDATALAAFAQAALVGVPQLRVEFDRSGDGEHLREEFHRLGWVTARDVWMRHRGPAPQIPAGPEEVPFPVANPLRRSWHLEDHPHDTDFGFLADWEAISRMLGVRIWVIRERGEPVAFAGLERRGESAEVGPAYVRADRRGDGLGARIVAAALAAAGELAGDVWIAADDEGRPRRLYERLGFEPVCTTLEAMRWPAR